MLKKTEHMLSIKWETKLATYVYVYVYVSYIYCRTIFVCACVCKRSRVRETDEDGARERENKKAHWLIRTLSRQLSLLEEEIYTVSTSVPSQTNSISELTENSLALSVSRLQWGLCVHRERQYMASPLQNNPEPWQREQGLFPSTLYRARFIC